MSLPALLILACSAPPQGDDLFGGPGDAPITETPKLPNTIPTIEISCAGSTTQDNAYSCSPAVNDPDPDTHLWSFDTGHGCGAWLQVSNTNGNLTGTPSDDAVGSCNVKLKVTDSRGDSGTADFTIDIANVAPTLSIENVSGIPMASTEVTLRTDVQVQASEEGFGVYSFNHGAAASPKCSDNGILTLNSLSGEILFDPENTFNGVCNIALVFDDQNSAPNSQVTSHFTVTIDSNALPTISGSCPIALDQDAAYACSPVVSDANGGDTHTWRFAPTNNCSWAAIDSGTGAISGTPTDDDFGSCTLSFVTNDSHVDSNTLTFTVNVANLEPTLSIANASPIAKASPLTVIRIEGSVEANEEGFGDYSINDTTTTGTKCADNGPVTIDSDDGTVSWDPIDTYSGDCQITVEFDDKNGQANSKVTAQFTATVLNDPPTVTGLSNDTTPSKSKTWNWGCDQVCEFRFAVNTASSHTFSSEAYGAAVSTTQSTGTDTFFVHVQARNTTSLMESTVMSVSAVIDNTAPSDPSGLGLAGDMTETATDTLSWTASTDETELEGYQLAVGTTPGGTELVGWTSVGDVTSHQFTGVTVVVAQNYYTSVKALDKANNESAEVTSVAWVLPGPPDAISELLITSTSSTEIGLSWVAPADNGRAITDYTVEYKLSSGSTWTTFADGVSTATTATVTGLTASTEYDFRVFAYNGASSPASNIATGETGPDDPFFDPTIYKAMNLGGATASAVVAMEDNTIVKLNDTQIATLNAGQVHTFTSAQNDLITGDKPIFAAGLKSTGSGDNRNGNMVWNTPDWAGKSFIFTGTRNQPHLVTVHAFEDASITIKQGTTTITTQNVLAGNNHTFSLTQYGGFEMTSDELIIAHMHSSGGSVVVDPKPLLPASKDIIGFPSTTLKLTTLIDNNDYTSYHSNSSSATGTLTAGTATSINPQGITSLYQSESLRIKADEPVVGNSNADSNGYCSAPFLPTAMMKKRYAINVEAEWVAFASLEPGDIDMIDPATGTPTTLTLTRTGADPNAPYRTRTTNKAAGFRFESTVKFAAWYEPKTGTNGADNDETILFGAD